MSVFKVGDKLAVKYLVWNEVTNLPDTSDRFEEVTSWRNYISFVVMTACAVFCAGAGYIG
jgi:hypothetical protein